MIQLSCLPLILPTTRILDSSTKSKSFSPIDMKDISIDTKDTFIQNQLCSYINNKIIMADSINKVDPGLQKGSQFDSS